VAEAALKSLGQRPLKALRPAGEGIAPIALAQPTLLAIPCRTFWGPLVPSFGARWSSVARRGAATPRAVPACGGGVPPSLRPAGELVDPLDDGWVDERKMLDTFADLRASRGWSWCGRAG